VTTNHLAIRNLRHDVILKGKDKVTLEQATNAQRERERVSRGIIIIIIIIVVNTIALSLGGSSPYTSTDKTNKNIALLVL